MLSATIAGYFRDMLWVGERALLAYSRMNTELCMWSTQIRTLGWENMHTRKLTRGIDGHVFLSHLYFSTSPLAGFGPAEAPEDTRGFLAALLLLDKDRAAGRALPAPGDAPRANSSKGLGLSLFPASLMCTPNEGGTRRASTTREEPSISRYTGAVVAHARQSIENARS